MIQNWVERTGVAFTLSPTLLFAHYVCVVCSAWLEWSTNIDQKEEGKKNELLTNKSASNHNISTNFLPHWDQMSANRCQICLWSADKYTYRQSVSQTNNNPCLLDVCTFKSTTKRLLVETGLLKWFFAKHPQIAALWVKSQNELILNPESFATFAKKKKKVS